MVVCVAPVAKFWDYIFKPDATHGKDHVFRSLGYGQADSAELAALFEQQAADKYAIKIFRSGAWTSMGNASTSRYSSMVLAA